MRFSRGTVLALSLAFGGSLVAAAGSASAAPSPEAQDAGPAATHWAVVSSVPVDNSGTLAINQTTNTVYESDFVPGDEQAPKVSKLVVIDGSTNTQSGEVDDMGFAPANGSIAIDESTNTLYVPQFGSAAIAVVDGATNTISDTIPRENSMPWGAVADPDNHTIYVTDGNDNNRLPQGQVYIVDQSTNTITSAVGIDNTAFSPALDPGEHQIFVPIQGDNYVLVFDTQTNTVVKGIYGMSAPTQIAIDPVLHRAFVTDDGTNSVSIIDTTSDTVIGTPITIPVDSGLLTGITVDPTTHRVFVSGTAGETGPARVWELDGTTGAIIDTIDVPGVNAADVAINPVTQTLYVATDLSGDGHTVYALQQVPDPTPTPAPTATPVAASTSASTLAESGSDAQPWLIVAAALLSGGAIIVATAATRRTARRRHG